MSTYLLRLISFVMKLSNQFGKITISMFSLAERIIFLNPSSPPKVLATHSPPEDGSRADHAPRHRSGDLHLTEPRTRTRLVVPGNGPVRAQRHLRQDIHVHLSESV